MNKMFGETDENMAKFVDAHYFPPNGQKQQQPSYNCHGNNNKIGKFGPPIVSKQIAEIYRQLLSC